MKRALLVSLIVVVILVSTIFTTQLLLPQLTRELHGKNTGVVGTNPRVYGNLITFHTREQDVGVDLNGDGDIYDTVVRYYEIPD